MTKKKILILATFLFTQFGCIPSTFIPEPINETKNKLVKEQLPTSNEIIIDKPIVKENPTLENSPTPSEVKQPQTETVSIPILKAIFNPLTIKEANSGSSLKITGSNFVTEKLSKVIFLNENGNEFNAQITNKTDNEISLIVPNISENNNKTYNNSQIYLIKENGEKLFFSNLNITYTLAKKTESSSTIFPVEPETTVSLNFNPNKPEKSLD